MSNCIRISGVRIDMVQISEIIDIMERWIIDKRFHNYIVVSNADTIVKSKQDSKVREAVNSSSLSIPDGISLVLLGRVSGFPLEKRTYGPDLMLDFLKVSEEKGFSHFLYGTTEETLAKLINNIRKLRPKIKIAGSYAPPFRQLTQKEDGKIVDLINNSTPDVLWVGLGCPKQELWMHEHRDRINAPVMIGVGAAFDFLAGTKPQAPRWIRDNGFEWLFRLVTEPKRLWRRYLVDYPLFIYYILAGLISLRYYSQKGTKL